MKNILNILKKRNFLSLFFAQFLGAFNDNVFRIFLLSFVTFSVANMGSGTKGFFADTVIGFFMLPFFLFSALAGEIADKYQKSFLIKIIKSFEIVVMAMALFGFILGNIWFLMFVLFLMGTQSAFFGPLKYSILPEILERKEYVSGNGIIEAGTFLSILLGVILGGFFSTTFESQAINMYVIASCLILISVLGFVACYFMKNCSTPDKDAKIEYNFIKSTIVNMKYAKKSETIFLTILGISWFWLIGSVLMAKMPVLSSDILKGDSSVFVLLLSLFSLGVGVGSILCQFVLKNEISAKFVPITAILMTVFLFDLGFASYAYTPEITINIGIDALSQVGKIGAMDFLSNFQGARIAFDFFMVAMVGGVYIVPLNAILQVVSKNEDRSKIIATNNIINSLFMVMGSVLTVVLSMFNFSIPFVFMIVAGVNFVVAIYICLILPFHIFKPLIRKVLKIFYKVELIGVENYKNDNNRSIIIANHQSFIDPILLGAFLPGRPTFAINTYIAENPFLKPLLKLVDIISIDPTKPLSTKRLVQAVNEGKTVVIFPEGRITTTGALMKIYDGVGLVADKTDADIIPVRISGAEYSIFARFRSKLSFNPSSKIKLMIMPKRKIEIDKSIKGRRRRLIAKQEIYNIMSDMMFRSSSYEIDLFKSLLDARNLFGGSHKIVEDISRKVINYDKFVMSSFILGKQIEKQCEGEINIGLMLPNLNIHLIMFFGMQAYHKIPAMINFSAGVASVLSMAKTANIKTIYTSTEFVEKAKLEKIVEALKNEGITIRYVEEFKSLIGLDDMVTGYIKSKFSSVFYKQVDADSPAVILFTSGSEGMPKGVVLSHKNLNANRSQVLSRVPANVTDILFNALPMFHSFGLSIGTILPVLLGAKLVLYPSPLHYRVIPELIYDSNATILFGTDTFLSKYAKVADPYDFYSINFIFAGAEKLKEETKQKYSEKFGVRICEGYGATETSPLISVNTPMHFKNGTVGRILPDMEYKIEPIEGVEEGGRLFVKGPNVMKGYLKSENPGVLEPLSDGWYDTGDIVTVDEEGYISIKGRVKRFAKLGGEMVALDTVESSIKSLYPNFDHAVISIPSDKKGEQLLLITTNKTVSIEEIIDYYRTSGLSEISIPKMIEIVNEIPLLGTGKTDYVSLKAKYNG